MISLELQPFPGCGPPWTKGSYYRLCCDCGMVGAYTDLDEATRVLSSHVSICRRALEPRSAATINLSTLDKDEPSCDSCHHCDRGG